MNIRYIFLGILTNFIWGLAFFVPYYLKSLDPVLIVLSRYFFYGATSFALLLFSQPHWRSLTRLDWRKAMIFSFAGNLGYYLTVVLAIHDAGIVLPTLIIGALPVTMMIYGNITKKEFQFTQLVLPIILIAGGIIGLRWLQLQDLSAQPAAPHVFLGSIWALVALAIWTWFGVSNANYLKTHTHISGYSWSIAIGVCCLLQTLLFCPLYLYFNPIALLNFTQDHLFYQLIIGGFILGFIASWLATVWWNSVSRHLPTAFIGQLLVFETIASLLYGYIHDRIIPQPSFIVCIVVVLCGILLGIRGVLKR